MPHCKTLAEMRGMRVQPTPDDVFQSHTVMVQTAPQRCLLDPYESTVVTCIPNNCTTCVFFPQRCADGRPLAMWCAYCLRQRLYPDFSAEPPCSRRATSTTCVTVASKSPRPTWRRYHCNLPLASQAVGPDPRVLWIADEEDPFVWISST